MRFFFYIPAVFAIWYMIFAMMDMVTNPVGDMLLIFAGIFATAAGFTMSLSDAGLLENEEDEALPDGY